MTPKVDVSVVLPVHDTMPDLKDCMNSLVEQHIGKYRYEVIAVDDGSTDGSGKLLDGYAARHRNVHVIHQDNSGWPGQPRNVGIEASSGRYVFFMDADDELGRDSLRRQLSFAERNSSDIVVPKIVTSGRPISSLWTTSCVNADRTLLFKSLSPQKLVRRSFLDRNGLRFPEGVVPLEDGILFARAYLVARRVSVLADYEHYHKHERGSRENISLRGKQPAPFAESVTKIIDIVYEHAADTDTAEKIVLDVYRRKALKFLLPERFGRYKPWRRTAWVNEIKKLADTRVPPELEARLPIDARLRSMAARSGDVGVVLSLIDALKSGRVPARVLLSKILITPPAPDDADVDVTNQLALVARAISVRSIGNGYTLQLEAGTQPIALRDTAVELVACQRGADAHELVVPLSRSEESDPSEDSPLTARLELAPFARTKASVWDLYVRLRLDGTLLPLRPTPLSINPDSWQHPRPPSVAGRRRVEPYITRSGNLALTVGPNTTMRLVLPCLRLMHAVTRWIRHQRVRLTRRARRALRNFTLRAGWP